MSRSSLAAAALAALALLGACSSDDSSDASSDDAPASSTTTAAEGVDDEATTEEDGAAEEDGATGEDGAAGDDEVAAEEAEYPDPCEALTAEEMSAAVGAPITAEIDEMSGVCAYTDASGDTVATMIVTGEEASRMVAEGFLEYPPPGATYTEVEGLGDLAVVSEPPEGRAILIMGGIGYDIVKGFGGEPLDAAQLEAALRSIAAS